MSYLQRNNRRRSFRPLVISIVSLMVVCVLVGIFLRGPLARAVSYIVGPGTWLRQYEERSVTFIGSLFSSKYRLQERITSLEQDNARLKDELAVLQDEQMLAGLAVASNASGTPRIIAHVIMRPPYSPYDSITISKGNLDGITLGHKVFPIDRRIPIGTVTDVTGHTATITLFSSSGQRVSVMIGTSTEAWQAEGRGGGMFEVRIPQAHKVARGDHVILSAESPIPFTIIDEIVSSPADPFQTVRFLLPVPFGSLSLVGIAERP